MTRSPETRVQPASIRAARGWRHWAFGLASVTLSLIFSLLLVEVILRVFDLAPVGGLATVSQKEFERIPGMFRPGQRFIDRSNRGLPHRTTIDSLGYRDERGFPRDKPPGELRILMLGDSFTFGSYVDDDKTEAVQLEALLRQRCTAPVRVINAGVGGSTITMADAVAARALPLGIDLAVLTFTENDVSDLMSSMWDQLARNRAAKSRFPMSLLYPVLRNLATWNLLLEVQARWTAGQNEAPAGAPGSARAPTGSVIDTLRTEYANRLHRLRDWLKEAGVQLVFAVYPSHHSLPATAPTGLVQWADSIGQDAGLPTVNYLAALRSAGGPTEALYLFPHDGHPSAKGYLFASRALGERLLALPVVARHCGGEAGSSRPAP